MKKEKEALQILYNIIEQANAQGMFKKFATLDTVRLALSTIDNAITELEKIKTHVTKPNTDSQ